MTLGKWGYLFGTTLGIGMFVGLLLGIILKLTVEGFVFEGFPVGPYEWVFILLGASVIAVVSHAGLFAYLIVRFLGLSLFRRKLLWDILQSAFVIIAFFDLVYLRYTSQEGQAQQSFISYAVLPLLLLICSLIIGYWKVKETNRSAWIPTVFFLFVGTILEAVPAIRLDQPTFIFFTIAILIVCNSWQILQLHRLIGKKN